MSLLEPGDEITVLSLNENYMKSCMRRTNKQVFMHSLSQALVGAQMAANEGSRHTLRLD